MQQTTLPDRVARSAKDLASATLSGATFELKDPRDNKYAGTSSQASTSFQHLSSGSAQPRPGIYARGSSFRDETDESHREKAERDFERFQQLDDCQSEFTACLASLRDTSEPQEGSYDSKSALLTDPSLNFEEIVKPAKISTVNADKSKSTLRHELASESISKRDLDSERTAAVRRLHQIGAHLQNNLAMQTLQPELYTQSDLMDESRSIFLDQLSRQTDDEVRNATRTNEAESSFQDIQDVVGPQHQDTIVRVKSAPRSPPEKEDNVLQRQFHCPYYACHRNLKLHSTSSLSSSQRQCVHVGCNFTTETFSSWAEHIHMPHHDLLGSV
jgi:hypothetical protein